MHLLFELCQLFLVSILTPSDNAARIMTVGSELASEILGWTAVEEIAIAPVLN